MRIAVNYLDEYQHPKSYTHEMTFEVKETPIVLEEGVITNHETSGPWSVGRQEEMEVGQRILQAILGFFGLATRTTPVPWIGIPRVTQP